jgi:hypothetical protein
MEKSSDTWVQVPLVFISNDNLDDVHHLDGDDVKVVAAADQDVLYKDIHSSNHHTNRHSMKSLLPMPQTIAESQATMFFSFS